MQSQIGIKTEGQEAEHRQLTEQPEVEAEAQRSTARAQSYQNRPGELYTSTLLVIDSMRRSPSTEAEEVLRRNISVLPRPFAQSTHAVKIDARELNPEGNTCVR